MIKSSEVFGIGRFAKPHGLGGELVFIFTDEVFDRTQAPFWLLEIDGILVPFFVESYSFRSENSALVKLENIDNESEARFLADRQVIYHREYADGFAPEISEDRWDIYLGFEIRDVRNNELLIPATEDFIHTKDIERRILFMKLPEGLSDIEQ